MLLLLVGRMLFARFMLSLPLISRALCATMHSNPCCRMSASLTPPELAMTTTGLSHFGSNDYREPMRLLLDDYDRHAHFSDAGVQIVSPDIVGKLVGRLQAKHEFKLRPESACASMAVGPTDRAEFQYKTCKHAITGNRQSGRANYIKEEAMQLKELKDKVAIKAADGEAAFCRADMANEVEVRALIDFALKTYGLIDVLMNNHASIAESIDADVRCRFMKRRRKTGNTASSRIDERLLHLQVHAAV